MINLSSSQSAIGGFVLGCANVRATLKTQGQTGWKCDGFQSVTAYFCALSLPDTVTALYPTLRQQERAGDDSVQLHLADYFAGVRCD